MKTFKRVIVALLVAAYAAACATPEPASSYVRSPFAGMHGQ